MEAGIPLHEVPGRLMGFWLHFMEARLWSYAWQEYAYPEAFASLLSSTSAERSWKWAEKLWVASTDAEAVAHRMPGAWRLRQEIYWLSWPLVQWMLRQMAHHGFRPQTNILEFIRLMFTRIGDTKASEESHKIGRNLEQHGQQRDVLEPAVFFLLGCRELGHHWNTGAYHIFGLQYHMLTRHGSMQIYRPRGYRVGPRFMHAMG